MSNFKLCVIVFVPQNMGNGQIRVWKENCTSWSMHIKFLGGICDAVYIRLHDTQKVRLELSLLAISQCFGFNEVLIK